MLGAMAPIYWVADLPGKTTTLREDWFTSRSELAKENEVLRTKVFVMQGRLQQMVKYRTENRRLRQLLNSSLILQDNLLVAEVVGVSPARFNHFLILDKGSDDNVYEGQSVLDAQGLLGQVVEVNQFNSRVLLLTDNAHAVPVQVSRSGVRGIVEGKGNSEELDVMQVPLNSNIKVGDVLVSSGLAGRFPSGYPVAVISQVDRSGNQFFADIKAKPLAQMDRSRHVLLVFSEQKDLDNQFDFN